LFVQYIVIVRSVSACYTVIAVFIVVLFLVVIIVIVVDTVPLLYCTYAIHNNTFVYKQYPS
jgi:uncharacterized integral membrane protein